MATTERDYYEVLGVPRGASEAEIKRAFRRLARELHPDVSDAADASERFRELAEAYEVLSNPETRELYDRYGRAGLQRGGFVPGEFDFGNLSDLFAAFFGEGLLGQSRRSARAERGADIVAVAEIALAEAYTGTTLHVPVRVAVPCVRCGGDGEEPGSSPTRCPTCGGEGRVQQVSQSVFGQFVRAGPCPRCRGAGRIIEFPCHDCEGAGRTLVERELAVDVPAGIHDGQRIRLRGEGHAGASGGAAGDVFVQVHVRPEPRLTRDGDDLLAAVELTMIEAALGATVSVPTPAGALEVELPPGCQPGDVHVLQGRGMPSLATGRHGDLRVRIDVRIPRRLDGEQRELLLELERRLGEDAYGGDDGFFERLKSAFR
jgi:molecular chaperone DnaJ